MSLRAMLWALYDAEVPESQAVAKLILLVLADHAGNDGRGAFPSVATVCAAVRCSESTAHRKIKLLNEQELILVGDQQHVAHVPVNRRPRVWDLPIPADSMRGVSVTPQRDSRGVTPRSARGVTGVSLVTPKPIEPKAKPTRARETADGAVVGCAAHAPRRSPACPDCQRTLPPAKDTIRPVPADLIATLRGRA